jgi:hypothetical protein
MSTEASQPRLCRSQLREEAFEWVGNEVVFSDMLEVKRADGTRVRGCFALRQRLPAGWSFTSLLVYTGRFLRAVETRD